MESYFFIPGDRTHKIKSVTDLGVSHIIIDMEDAVKASERDVILLKFQKEPAIREFYIRIPIHTLEGTLDVHFLKALIKLGCRKFVFPKLEGLDQAKIIFEEINADIDVILLVETPLIFLELKEVLMLFKNNIKAIGLGSHDFMSVIGGEHTLVNLEYTRQHLLYLARAFSIQAIDIASMELDNLHIFKKELLDGFRKGYDAKFFIHPKQFELYNNLSLYTKKEFEWATKILDRVANEGGVKEFSPVVINGQVIERPHLNKALKILKFYKEKHESK